MIMLLNNINIKYRRIIIVKTLFCSKLIVFFSFYFNKIFDDLYHYGQKNSFFQNIHLKRKFFEKFNINIILSH